jgi:small subunit ribosomal protein S8
MLQDPLANVLIAITNAESVGKMECVARPSSKLITKILRIMQKNGYLGDFELINDGRGGFYKIRLNQKLSKCRAIKPRQYVKIKDLDRFVRRFLPAKNFGILILSTNKGVMTHHEAKRECAGGALIAYVY